MSIFVLFPVDLYKDVSYLRNCKVFLVEHKKFFDRSEKRYGSMKLNILKPVFHRATMQKYYEYLQSEKIDVEYVPLKDSWIESVQKRVRKVNNPNNVSIKFFDPVDRQIEDEIAKGFEFYDVIDSPRFILNYEDLESYSSTKTTLRHSAFYSWIRKKTGILMRNSINLSDSLKPIGGKITYDVENRKPPYDGMAEFIEKHIGKQLDISDNDYVVSAVKYVIKNIPETHLTIWKSSYSEIKKHKYILGSLRDSIELNFPIDHDGTSARLKFFISKKLANYGDYQDAILDGVDTPAFIYHSGLSTSLNIGLITPNEIIDAVIRFYESRVNKSNKKIDDIIDDIIYDVEGFVRQIIGWREFCRYTYEFESDLYSKKNYFNAKEKLDRSWYEASTEIDPVDISIEKAFRFGYLHHIERLMVVANFMTISGIAPDEMFRWFTEFSLDSYDWVMEYNIYVMGSYSDGGNFTTKPYISSSNYIIRMSDYPKDSSATWTTIWDLKFWKFILVNKKKIEKVNRLKILVKYAKKHVAEIKKILEND